ncbi:MAG: hypothetical protein AAF362_06265 [Pseudomonadota bacterium]
MANYNNQLKVLIKEFETVRKRLRQTIEQGGNDSEVAVIDSSVSELFDRICSFPVNSEDDSREIRLFAIKMIYEICECDHLVMNCLELLDRKHTDQVRMMSDH